ncbi:MAG: 4-hydroxybenzoate octaprenyltransferase [Betaproteobacteria bacterium]|nr:4-hydroxybenzoate octaprenyltransferase [Betaproteobacteria bacterium]
MRLDKPIGTLLLLWPTLWALWLSSGGKPDWTVVIIFMIGTLLMRSAGCVINDCADRDFDKHVKRTQDRPVTSGKVTLKEAFALFIALLLCSLALVLPLRNLLVIELAFVAVFLAISYPLTKRFFALPQAYLGIAFGFGIPMSYAAHLHHLPLEAWWLLGINIFWSLAYDTEYAMVDRDDDLRIGIKTSAITFGRFDVVAVMFCYAAMLSLFVGLGWRYGMGPAFYLGLSAAAAISIYHWRLIRERERENCFKAFMHNNWYGGAIFAGIAADYLLR